MLFGFVESELVRMPDTSHQRARVDDFELYAPSTPGRGKGGVFLARNGKSYIVNIRPPKWDNKNKFWIGKIESFEWAQYAAETLFFYCGKPRFHFKDANFNFPPLECIGAENSIPERLTTTEQFSKYVRSIAGKDFALHRTDFVQKVERVIKGDAFILQGETFLSLRGNRMQTAAVPREQAGALPSAARSREEAPASSAAEAARMDDDGDRADSETPMEVDDVSVFMANLVNGSASSQAIVAGFALNLGKSNAGVSEKSLHSVEESLESRYYNLFDCPTGRNEGWNEAIEELNKVSSFRGSLTSAAGASTSNAAEVYHEGMKDNLLMVFEGVSFLPGTMFVALREQSSSSVICQQGSLE